jgi:nicotinamidase-related amidase
MTPPYDPNALTGGKTMKRVFAVFSLLVLVTAANVYAEDIKYFKLTKGKTALIVVDMQNDFVRDGGKLVVKTAKATLQPIKKLIDFFRTNNMPVVYTKVVNRNDNLRAKFGNIKDPSRAKDHVIEPGYMRHFTDVNKKLDVTDVVEEIYPTGKDYIVVKDYYDAFHGTHMDVLLRSLGIEYVVVTGTVTHLCVETTAKGAFQHHYGPVLVSDCISTWMPDAFVSGMLGQFTKFFGRVLTSDEVVKEMSK